MAFAKARSYPTTRGRTNWLAVSFLSALSLGGAIGCGHDPGSAEGDPAVAESAEALSVSGTNVLGFETPVGWFVLGGLPSSTTVRTQGSAALAVAAPIFGTTLTSVPLSSGLAPLAQLTSAGSSVSIDVQIPASEPNPHNFGNLELYISSPSHHLVLQALGSQASLTGQVPGTFQTYQFPVSDSVRKQLTNVTYSDLTFTIEIDAPVGSLGTYVFDNLRTQSPSTQQVGSLPSVNVTALLTQSPAVNTPGQAAFPAGTIQIPASFFVNVGDAGTGTALFTLGLGSTTNVSCTYKASSDKTSYVFSSCTTKNVAGDFVAATSATLKINAADPAAPLTKIKAQLAYDAVGDQVGTNLVPPIPTYWGQTLSDINTISQAFAQLQIKAPPPGAQRFVSLPIPNLALRQGDGSPLNALSGATPRPAGDPPFDFKGDLNNSPTGDPSGLFDAYYEINGNISANESGTTFTSHFDGAAKVGVVVVGQSVDALKVSATVDTNNGGTSATGNVNPTSTATFQAFLFGTQFENDTATQQTGFNFNPTVSQTFSTPPIPIWIFSITAGVTGSVGVDFTGALAINGFQLTGTPHATISANVEGGINVVVASGGVNVTVDLIDVSIPTVAQLTLDVSTEPTVCAATLNASIDGSVQLSSGGGKIDLDASIGVCPLCLSDSFNIFDWAGLSIATKSFPSPFPITISGQVFSLPASLCRLPLTVAIATPAPAANVFAGIPEFTSASATRPPVGNEIVPDSVACQYVTWTSSDPGATFSPSATGCSPSVTFSAAAAGTSQTLTASADDQFGETGSATVTVNVAAQPAGPVPMIIQPLDGSVFAVGGVTLQGTVTGGSGTITAVWTDTISNTVLLTQTVAAGTNVSLPATAIGLSDGIYTVVVTTTDSESPPLSNQSAPVTFTIEIPQ